MFQIAFAIAFENELKNFGTNDSFITNYNREMEAKRNRMVKMLTAADFVPTITEGGNFLIANFTRLDSTYDAREDPLNLRDYKFASWLIRNKKIFGHPISSFYDKHSPNRMYDAWRLVFVKVRNDFKHL